MAHQQTPSYEDLEPEGEDETLPDGYGEVDDFDDDPALFSGSRLGEFEYQTQEVYDEFDLDPGDEPPPRRRSKRDKRGKPPCSATKPTAKWASQPPRSRKMNGRGYRSRAAYNVDNRFRDSEEEYWVAWESGLFDEETDSAEFEAWSAALVENYELMEMLAMAAAKTKRSAEADGLVAAMVPLALQLTPQAYRALWPALPALIRGTVQLARKLRQRRATRRLVGTLPLVLKATVSKLARYAASGRQITQPIAAKTLVGETAARLGGQTEEHVIAPQPGFDQRRSTRDERKRRWEDGDDY